MQRMRSNGLRRKHPGAHLCVRITLVSTLTFPLFLNRRRGRRPERPQEGAENTERIIPAAAGDPHPPLQSAAAGDPHPPLQSAAAGDPHPPLQSAAAEEPAPLLQTEADENPTQFPQSEYIVPEDITSCVICMDQRRDALLLPCRHLCTCVECTEQIGACPMCRVEFKTFVKVFMS